MTALQFAADTEGVGDNYACDDVVRAIASHGLASSALARLDRPVPRAEWSYVLDRVCRAQLTGLLAKAISDRQFPVTDDQLDELKAQDRDAQARSVLLERAALRLIALLTEQGIPVAAVGGFAAAHRDYSDPSQRPIEDISLLVPASSLKSAQACLEVEGWRRLGAEPGRDFDRRFGMGSRLKDRGGFELDLVRTLAPPPYSLAIPAPAIWDQLEQIEVGRAMVAIPNGPVRLIHACLGMATSDGELPTIQTRDAAQAIYQAVEASDVLELARQWQVSGLLAWAVDRVWNQLGLAESLRLGAWAERYEPVGWEKRALARLRDPHSGYAARAITGLRLIPGIRDRAVFVGMTLRPDPSYRKGRRRQRIRRLAYYLRRAR